MENLEVEGHSAVADLLRSASALSISTLDLSRRGLREIPVDFPVLTNLECLYLEGNSLKCLPDSLFLNCLSLRWLDLRNNNLRTIPSGISGLRNLRTLLLEGNKITSLPPQLGLLYKLNGLSLSGNPLQSPPMSVIQKGTQAVLQYLRDLISNDEEEPLEESSEDDNADDRVHLEPVPAKRSLLNYSGTQQNSQRGLFLKQATLHSSINQQRLKQEQFADLLSSIDSFRSSMRVKSRKKQQKREQQRPLKQQIDQAEKEKITKTLEREKSKQSLDEWRKETKQKQIQAQMMNEKANSPPSERIPSQPPFATHEPDKISTSNSIQPSTDSTESGEGLLTEWVSDYVKQLRLTRERGMGGANGTQQVTSDILDAEVKLAEALAARKKFESDNNREYRLRAYTGDSLF